MAAAQRPPANTAPETSHADTSRTGGQSSGADFSKWRLGPRYIPRSFLGKGSYGDVCEATDTHTPTHERVAVKRISNIFTHDLDARRLLREVYLLRRLRHPNIITLRDIVYAPADACVHSYVHTHTPAATSPSGGSECSATFGVGADGTPGSTSAGSTAGGGEGGDDGSNELYLVFDFLDTDMHKLVISNQFLLPLHIQTFVYQLLCGVKYLHAARIIHRDLKPANILINEDCSLRICDFGLARILPASEACEEPPAPVDPRAADPARADAVASPAAASRRLCPDATDREDDVASDSSGATSTPSSAASDSGAAGEAIVPAGTKRSRDDALRASATDASADTAQIADAGGAAGRKRLAGAGTPHPAKQHPAPAVAQTHDAALAAARHKTPPTAVKRTLTRHVVTRFYRAPELILLQDYTLAVDIWSIGCILAELLFMESGTISNYRDRRPLFPGRTCFPLSADHPSNYADRLDQLNVIFNVIGTPSEEDIAQCDNDVQPYLRRLPARQPMPLQQRFPAAIPTALDLLSRMLAFNPTKRITIDAALEHPFFAPVRDKRREVTASLAELRLDASVTEGEVDISMLRMRLRDEVVAFKLEKMHFVPAVPNSKMPPTATTVASTTAALTA